MKPIHCTWTPFAFGIAALRVHGTMSTRKRPRNLQRAHDRPQLRVSSGAGNNAAIISIATQMSVVRIARNNARGNFDLSPDCKSLRASREDHFESTNIDTATAIRSNAVSALQKRRKPLA